MVSKLRQKKFYDVRYSSLNRAKHKLSSPALLFYDERLIETILRNANHTKVEIVLEVGAGQGTDAILLSRNANHVVGTDISSKALGIGRMLSKAYEKAESISFVVSDAEHLPFKDSIFNIVCCKDVLHHVADTLKTVSEMKRVSREGGTVIAVEANALNPQMIVIGLIYSSVDKGVFRNTKGRLFRLFLEAKLSNVHTAETEILPRQILFEFRSPINAVFKSDSLLLLRILEKIEMNLQKRSFLRTFSNYLLIVGSK